MEREAVWVLFAANALSTVKTPEGVIYAAAVADRMTEQWALRYGDAAFLLSGQSECAACHKPLDKEFTPSEDGIKFCNIECLKSTGREE